jgi:recombination protein RecA
VGLQARLMSKAMRKLTGFISKSRAVAVFINQIREKIGISYGNPETTTGGRALKFYSTIRMEVRKGEVLKQGTESIGAHTKVKVVKNKVAPPFRNAEFDILYGKGISKESELVDIGVRVGVVEKSGTWFSYNGARIGQGKDNARIFFVEHPDMAAEVEAKIREKILEGASPAAEESKAPLAPVSGGIGAGVEEE